MKKKIMIALLAVGMMATMSSCQKKICPHFKLQPLTSLGN